MIRIYNNHVGVSPHDLHKKFNIGKGDLLRS